MKVRIENKSSSAITVRGRHTLRIPAEGVLETNLGDTDQTSKTLSRLRREYPALKITVTKDADESADNGAQAQNLDNGGQPQADNGSDTGGTPDANAVLMEKDAFTSLAKASKGSGDKWNVVVEGVKTFKIKDAADEAAAIELAYTAYLETFSATNAG